MGRISAGNNLTIDTDSSRWRLLVNGDGSERVLVEAAAGQPLRYMPTFGQRRRLPDTGVLPTIYIQRVVLGWSASDEAWHLGLILEPELADARGSRWCEVAHWPDPERDLYADLARDAAVGLAGAISRPFSLIPPAAQAEPPPPPPAVLPSLPVTVDLWQVSQVAPGELLLTRSSSWARGKALRILWYLFWTAIYVVLAWTTLQGRIAIPKPDITIPGVGTLPVLPYLGLLSAALLVLLTLSLVVRLLTSPNRIAVGGTPAAIRGLRGRRERWRIDASAIDAVYASQMVARKPRRDRRVVHYGELNLLMTDGSFRRLLDNRVAEEKPVASDGALVVDEVVPLTPDRAETALQIAAAHIGRALDRPVWYDQRVR